MSEQIDGIAPAAPVATETDTPPVELVVDETPSTEPVEQQPAEPTAETPTEPSAETSAESRPGTPDKALQKLQQDNAAAMRKIAELEQKVGPLTPVETKQLVAAKTKLSEVREKLTGDYDAFDHGRLAAEATSEIGGRVETIEQRIDRLERENREVRESAAWSSYEAKYPGVNLREVFSKSAQDAATELYGGADALDRMPTEVRSVALVAIQNRATRLMEERAGAARQQTTARTPAPRPNQIKPVQQRNPGGQFQPPTASEPQEDYSVLLAKEKS